VDRESGSAPMEMLRKMLEELDVFVGNTPQHDDMTCLLLKRGGEKVTPASAPVHPVERVHAFFLLHAVSHTLLEIRLCCLPVRGRSALSITFVLIGAAPFRGAPLQSLLPSSRRVWLTKALGL